MKRGLIVKGRRYYVPKLDEYVHAVSRSNMATFRRDNGTILLLHPEDVCYLSDSDFKLCDQLAESAKMSWFFPCFDDDTKTEFNLEFEKNRKQKKSYRSAIRDLSEGLIDLDFSRLEHPIEKNQQFREIIRGMGIDDPGDYISL